MENKLDKFSPSMILDYINCPRCFYYKYIAKIQLPQKQIHLLFGSAVHAGIEEMYHKREPLPMFIQTFDINKLTKEEKELHKEYLELGEEMLKNYSEIHPVLNNLYELDDGRSEVYIRRKLINPLTGEESSLPISGRIDRLTNGTRIIEYKTSAQKWNENDINYKIQTLLYNLWFYSEHKTLPLETIYIILLKKFKNVGRGEIHQVFSKHCTLTELASTFDEVELILHQINNGEFERPMVNHPRWCDCYKYEEALNINQNNI